ncbi:class I SAM-dependent methyltransferase [Calidifontibacter indicus]|uniref:class I SAM-dependent methyltransferase n=1 Tax=Calidifontibacter indicus TaxID=419650 RepID=UPI003D75B791
MARVRPVGTVTRGTTNPNRLRRCDRWVVATQREALLAPAGPPLVVDLGYGASPITAVELRDRLRAVRPDVRVVGVEIEPERIAVAKPLEDDTLSFRLGGFELPVEGEVDVVRAFNVLRQYDESQVARSWQIVQQRLSPTGVFVEGTCDEIGRLATWVALDRERPLTFTLSWRLGGLQTPSVIAERLPKVLIHRNVEGEPIHRLLRDLDRAWATAAPHASYGARQRFLATVRLVREWGWPVRDGVRRHRLGELTLDWSAVAPNGSQFG